MYRIYCDGFPLLDTNVDDLILENPRIKAQVNTVGEGSFGIYNNHPYFDKLKMLKSIFEVSDEYGVIFRGRMTEDTKDFNNMKAVDLEGAMAFFNDSVVRPYRFPKDFETDAGYIAAAKNGNVIKFYLNWLIENHNAQVEEEKRFKLGNVTVADPNNYITRADTDYPKTWAVLSSKLFNSSLGGYLCIRYEADGNYIDYLSEFTEVNEQGINYGENLLDITQNTVGGEAYSAIIPRGAKIGENEWEGSDGAVTAETRISIEELPDGNITDDIVKSGDTLYSKSAVAAFGWRYAPVSDTTWDNVSEPENLRRKGAEFLSGDVTKLPNEIKVTAVDLHCTDAQIRSLRIYKKIRVNTSAHGISDTFDLTTLDIPLLTPQSTKITVGKTVMTLTEYQDKQNSDFQTVITQTTNKVNKEFSSQKTLIETTSKEVKLLAEWQKSTDEALATISAGVEDNAAKIALVVGDGDEVEGSLIIAAINGETAAKISADRLDIEGKQLDIKVDATNIEGVLTVGDLLKVDIDESLVSIGGFTVTDNSLYSDKTAYDSDTEGVYIGTDGIGLGSGKFYVTPDGEFHSENAFIKGEVNATSGFIGGLNISSQTVSSGNDGLTFTTDGLVIAQNLEVRNDFIADTLKIGHIGGRNDGAAAIHFEEKTDVYQDVAVNIMRLGTSFRITCTPAPVKSFVLTIEYGFTFYDQRVDVVVPKDTASFDYEVGDLRNTTIKNPNRTVRLKTDQTLPAIGCEGDFSPFADSSYQLGTEFAKWGEIWATNGTIQTSDRNEKNTISPIAEKYGEVFDRLVPVTYKFNVNTSDRLHLGLIAQDVKRALDEVGIDSKDFAAYCEWEKDDGSIGCGMRYTELIPLLIYVVQKQNARINELEERISTNEQ